MSPCIFNMVSVQTISDWPNTGRRHNLSVFIAMFFVCLFVCLFVCFCFVFVFVMFNKLNIVKY